ncbi:unnamed protein product [Prorocentrum cordatum]|uniref:Pyrrolo-quinoline quinone repeat domain-containing protein n=1 Tax=Prorocentrum cordatum TaxID=2364126 RepID=A0ABN9UKZ0_9DINO|nr:unnamed protein product [Polarella glacialis]
MATGVLVVAAALSSLAPARAVLRTRASPGIVSSLGVMNGAGVTRYLADNVRVVRSKGKFYWGDPGNSEASRFAGATSLAENLSWGWHHPEGVYNTIPVGAPLIDGDMNIYLGSDDAVRKFTASGDLLWSYAPRGQLAAAPSLLLAASSSGRRTVSGWEDVSLDGMTEDELRPDAQTEAELRPEFQNVGGHGGPTSLGQIRVGDRLVVRPGVGYHANGKEYYRSGDVGEVAEIIRGTTGEHKARIRWLRTQHQSVAGFSALGKRFLRVKGEGKQSTTPEMLVGSTTSGFVFALSLESGEEIWAVQASDQIAGVKGSVSGKDGIVVAAANRCTDRYCYKYRNQTNPLVAGNHMIWGLLAADGSVAWNFKPQSPVWNFVPQYGNGTVMFSDFEGTTYCLDLTTGALRWQRDGSMGTYTQAHALYFPAGDLIFAMGVSAYDHKRCNPFPAPGVLPACNTWPGSPGWIRALNASSGRLQWEQETPQPPSSAGLGMMHMPLHTRLVVALGHNCAYNSPTQIWVLDPQNGHSRWTREGPTLWSDRCAGDLEGGDIRRAMGGRAACEPGAWSTPVVDSYGDVYIGNQVGELQRWGSRDRSVGARGVELLSTLSTGVAFQDQAISFAPGVMAVSTCTSLIVFQTAPGEPSLSDEFQDVGPAPGPLSWERD